MMGRSPLTFVQKGAVVLALGFWAAHADGNWLDHPGFKNARADRRFSVFSHAQEIPADTRYALSLPDGVSAGAIMVRVPRETNRNSDGTRFLDTPSRIVIFADTDRGVLRTSVSPIAVPVPASRTIVFLDGPELRIRRTFPDFQPMTGPKVPGMDVEETHASRPQRRDWSLVKLEVTTALGQQKTLQLDRNEFVVIERGPKFYLNPGGLDLGPFATVADMAISIHPVLGDVSRGIGSTQAPIRGWTLFVSVHFDLLDAKDAPVTGNFRLGLPRFELISPENVGVCAGVLSLTDSGPAK